jgi:hypothetical protein
VQVRRRGWNGKNMHIELVMPEDGNRLPFVVMCTADGKWVPWVCSQTDLLSFDWEEAT